MANNCQYHVIVKGKRNHCYAFFGSMPGLDFKEIDWEEGTEDEYEMKFSGNCKWSVDAYCKDSYQGDIPTDTVPDDPEGAEAFGLNYQGNTVKCRSQMFNVEVICNSADVEYDPRNIENIYEHYKNGLRMISKCPDELMFESINLGEHSVIIYVDAEEIDEIRSTVCNMVKSCPDIHKGISKLQKSEELKISMDYDWCKICSFLTNVAKMIGEEFTGAVFNISAIREGDPELSSLSISYRDNLADLKYTSGEEQFEVHDINISTLSIVRYGFDNKDKEICLSYDFKLNSMIMESMTDKDVLFGSTNEVRVYNNVVFDEPSKKDLWIGTLNESLYNDWQEDFYEGTSAQEYLLRIQNFSEICENDNLIKELQKHIAADEPNIEGINGLAKQLWKVARNAEWTDYEYFDADEGLRCEVVPGKSITIFRVDDIALFDQKDIESYGIKIWMNEACAFGTTYIYTDASDFVIYEYDSNMDPTYADPTYRIPANRKKKIEDAMVETMNHIRLL